MSNLWRYDFWKPKNPFAPPAQATAAPEPVAPKPEDVPIEELRAHAEALGLKVHHRAGRERILAQLRGAK